MLIYAPLDTGRVWLSEEIIKCENDEELKRLGEFYCDHFICVFKSTECSTPTSSRDSSDQPETPEEVQKILKGALRVIPKDQRTAKAQALVRDNYCCLITGYFDSYTYHKDREKRAQAVSRGMLVRRTNATYIFPPSPNKGITGADVGDPEIDYATSVSTVMDRFAGIDVTNELSGFNIHRLENIMTLEVGLYEVFEDFCMWLEETDTPNMYRIGGEPAYVGMLDPTVIFSTTTGLPLPDSRYLRAHAACVKVANMSGVNKIMMDAWDLEHDDDSYIDLLDHALQYSADTV